VVVVAAVVVVRKIMWRKAVMTDAYEWKRNGAKEKENFLSFFFFFFVCVAVVASIMVCFCGAVSYSS